MRMYQTREEFETRYIEFYYSTLAGMYPDYAIVLVLCI